MSRQHSTTHLAEEFEWQGCYLTLGLICEFSVEPYVPGCGPSYSSGGEPPSGGGIVDLTITLDTVKLEWNDEGCEEADWQPTAEQRADIDRVLKERLAADKSKLLEEVEEHCCEYAADCEYDSQHEV